MHYLSPLFVADEPFFLSFSAAPPPLLIRRIRRKHTEKKQEWKRRRPLSQSVFKIAFLRCTW